MEHDMARHASGPGPERAKVYVSIAAVLTLVALEAFRWNIVEVLTPFLAGPLIFLAWLLTWIAAIVFGVKAWRQRRKASQAIQPLAITVAGLLVALLVPFTQLWLRLNFELKREAREQVVQDVRLGKLVPNVSHSSRLIKLADGAGLSMGGDDIVVEGPAHQPIVMFYTYRGLMGSYSGFAWVPDGRKPEHYDEVDGPHAEIVPFGGHWYYISHR